MPYIPAPVGWAEKYTICVDPENVDKVLAWLHRGVAVRLCQDLSRAGRVIYQPADNCPTPHWAYSVIADIVPPDQVRNRIRITKYEREVARVPRPCRWADHPKHGNDCYACHGTGVAQTPITEIKQISGPNGRQAAKKELKGQGWKLTFNSYINEWEVERETVVKDFGQEIPNG